ncbi:hypothetical protein B0H14DRAFT_3442323 [Mycena olivaceomarginata]|nr:hypothetical protein B0H14DRAFT_3442323 [Mycena olivaceomarginata]
MSDSTLGFEILISRRSLIFQRRQLKWVLAAGVFFWATLGQTASWTSLLTPIDIIIATLLRGTEIDFSSETFANDFDELWNATTDIQNYTVTIVIDGQVSSYDGTMVCTVVSQIVTLFVSYSSQMVNTWILGGGVKPPSDAPTTLAHAVIYPGTGTEVPHRNLSYRLNYPLLMGVYIEGVIKFAGTLASPTGPLPADIPTSMRRNMTGSALTVTVGWEHNTGVNNAILIPSTFVAIASILIVPFAQCLKWVRGTAIEHVDFDPNEPRVLIAAASAGGVVDTFSGLTKEDLEGGGKKVIQGQAGGKDDLVQVR